MLDTSDAAAAVLREVIRLRTPAERLEAALRHSEDMRAIALARLRARYPDDSVLELVARLTGEAMTPGSRAGPTRDR